jgi:mannose-6-phosphate isomerase-like protein (cupin superfamily)
MTAPVSPAALRFAPPPAGRYGFAPCAGRMQGLARFMMATGRVPTGDLHPLHRHRGDEILHILEGRALLRLGEARLVLTAGDVAAIPPGTWHGMRALEETALAVVAELAMGIEFACRDVEGNLAGVAVFRRDMPWSLLPAAEDAWTDDETLAAVKAAAAAIDPLVMDEGDARGPAMSAGVG